MQLAVWLTENGVKRTDFAERIGVAPSYITMLCDGSCWPSRAVVERIRKVTEGAVTADDFMTPDSEPPTSRETPVAGAA